MHTLHGPADSIWQFETCARAGHLKVPEREKNEVPAAIVAHKGEVVTPTR